MKLYERPQHLTTRDEILVVAFDIYMNEGRFWEDEKLDTARGMKRWEPIDPTAFGEKIVLERVQLSPEVNFPGGIKSARFEIDDCQLSVSPYVEGDVFETDFIRDMLGKLSDAFYGHRHERCYRAKREERQAALAASGPVLKTKLVKLRGIHGQTLAS